MSHPVKLAGIYNHAANSGSVAAYELGGGLEGYLPPKLIDPETDEDENEDVEGSSTRFNSVQEWADWAVDDFMESKKRQRLFS
jgi:hypothetical protein